MHRLLRHIQACRNARLPGARLPFRIGNAQVGWVLPEFAEALCGFAGIRRDRDAIVLDRERAGSLHQIARALTDRGLLGWRDEAFDIRAEFGGPVLAQLDRAALPAFGAMAEGVHMNGLVRRASG